MKRSRFLEEKIIGILKEQQAGLGAMELCRKHGISDTPPTVLERMAETLQVLDVFDGCYRDVAPLPDTVQVAARELAAGIA